MTEFAAASIRPTALYRGPASAFATALLLGGSAFAADYVVEDQAAFSAALEKVVPGDRIVMADGEWRDFEIVFEAKGEEGAPITLTAETPGKVRITGRSNLSIGGEHLVVSGLTFTNGHSPTDEVISFRLSDDVLARHTRLTETVIDGFNQPNRQDQDSWVVVYGQHNRIDHNAFVGKTNKGPTLIVRLVTPESQDNDHLIDLNYFGPRDPLGGNGGETLRIGVSQTSRTRSGTLVSRNLFERASGEVEIISIKSEGNEVSENTFYESRGSVVFRHGGKNRVARNVFMGNGVPDTGGVRVINDNQTVEDNYFEGMRGQKFTGALVVMNGVPNSPENRYHQVENAKISNNSLIDIMQMGLGVGSDEERSAAPKDSEVQNNLILSGADEPLGIFDDTSGLDFSGNVTDNPAFERIGATVRGVTLTRASNGLLYPDDVEAGAPRDLGLLLRSRVGPAHYTKPAFADPEPRRVEVAASSGALAEAAAAAQAGDVLVLAPGRYTFSGPIELGADVTIEGAGPGKTALRMRGRGGLFKLPAQTGLTLKNLAIEASGSDPVIEAVGERYGGAYDLSLQNVTVGGARRNGPLISAMPETFARSIELDGVTVADWSGPVLDLSGEGLDGWYLTDDVEITGSTFTNVDGPVLSFGREGRDESTFGPRVVLRDTTFDGVATDGTALALDGIDGFIATGNRFADTGAIAVRRRVLGMPFETSGNRGAAAVDASFTGVEGEPMNLTLGDDQ